MNADTILLRQAHPAFVQNDLPTSQVFMPNSEDGGLMSAYDGYQISPQDSFDHYSKVEMRQSHSVWGLSKMEVDELGVPAESNPTPNNPAHALINFSSKPESAYRKVAKSLKALAMKRGCQYLPPPQ